MTKRNLATALTLVLCLVTFTHNTVFGSVLQAGSADLSIAQAQPCELACYGYTQLVIRNNGPDVASRVAITFAIPDGAGFDRLYVHAPNRTTSPGFGTQGAVLIELDRLEVGASIPVDVYLLIPNTEGWTGHTDYAISSETDDPLPEDNSLSWTFSQPFRPVVTQISELSDPFRLAIDGSHLHTIDFGYVTITSRRGAYYPPYESNADGSELVLGGGKELRHALPKNKEVMIYINNSEGGSSVFRYTRH